MQDDFKQRLEAIKQRIWWAGEHNFVDPAPIDDVKAFEIKFDVKLPEEYRWFITNIANGIIADQDSGKRNDMLTPHTWANYRAGEDEFNPSIPFPLNQRTVFYRLTDDSHYPFETFYDVENKIKRYRFGEVSLMSSGCGGDDFLVVKGEEYGNVWLDNYCSNEDVYPDYDLKLGKKRLGFTDWLELQAERLYSM